MECHINDKVPYLAINQMIKNSWHDWLLRNILNLMRESYNLEGIVTLQAKPEGCGL